MKGTPSTCEYRKVVTIWPCGCREEVETRTDGNGGGALSTECAECQEERRAKWARRYAIPRRSPDIPAARRRVIANSQSAMRLFHKGAT